MLGEVEVHQLELCNRHEVGFSIILVLYYCTVLLKCVRRYYKVHCTVLKATVTNYYCIESCWVNLISSSSVKKNTNTLQYSFRVSQPSSLVSFGTVELVKIQQ